MACSTPTVHSTEERDALTRMLFDAAAGTFRVFSIHLGMQLGLYDAFVRRGPMTPPDLAREAGVHPRYAREWLEQQTQAGILQVMDESAPADARRYALPGGHADVLANEERPEYLAPLVQMLVGATRPLDELVDAYRSGGGVPYAQYGEHMRDGQAAMNRITFLTELPRWVAAMPDLHARLRAPGARILDVGCGAAWSSIGLARAYPTATVDAIDLDEASVDLARRNVRDAGLDGRVRVRLMDAAQPSLAGEYDAALACECVHDVARPVEVLTGMRKALSRRGVALVVDERVGERFSARGEGFEWMMYGWSVLHCLPAGMSEAPSAATGTVMRRATLERYAESAGFAAATDVGIDNPFFRMYRLDP